MNSLINKEVEVIDLGKVDYQEAWDYQEKLFNEVIQIKLTNREKPEEEQKPTPNYLIFCEHPHVYTLGKSGSSDNLLLDDEGLKDKEATYYKINRGGDITYHGPGQLVCYPILDLDNFFEDIHKYLRLLEEAVIQTLKEHNIEAGRIKDLTGVWVDFKKSDIPHWNPRKICAMGVRSSRWVTMHGLALNVNTNLDYFDNIIPCGIDDKAVTSMQQEAGWAQNLDEVQEVLQDKIAELFEMNLI
ncbi:MAG: lipoyl(octanoyl) transferase LipB [Bacteroidota bacterium]